MVEQKELLKESIEMVQRYGKCLLKDSENVTKEDLSELSAIMMYLCDTKLKHEATQQAFSDAVQIIEDSLDTLDEDNIIDDYNSKVLKYIQKLKLGDDNKLYIEFKDLFKYKASESLDDSEITTVSEQIKTIDPITRLPLTDPVKNSKCGHVYEKATILELISKKTIKCPIPGCVAASSVKKSHLVPDLALKRQLESNLN